MKSGNHIINKVFLEINTRSEKEANRIKTNADVFFNEELYPALKALLDKYECAKNIIRFDRIDVDFNVRDWDQRDAIKFEFIKQVEQKLQQAGFSNKNELLNDFEPDKENIGGLKQRIEEKGNKLSTFLYFLENGYLPWFGKQDYINDVTNSINWKGNLEQAQFLASIKEVLLRNELATERLVLQFSGENVLMLVNSLGNLKFKNFGLLSDFIEKAEADLRNLVLTYLLKSSIKAIEKKTWYLNVLSFQFENYTGDISDEQLQDLIAKQINNFKIYFEKDSVNRLFRITEKEREEILYQVKKNISGAHINEASEELGGTTVGDNTTIISREFANSKKEKEPPFFGTKTNHIIVRNAGMVLFHPFLNNFFKSFGWINENGKIEKKSRIKAVQALYYCATGVNHFFEGDLMLEKYLCGVPLKMPVPAKSLLNADVLKEANAMLQAVIRNWPALKNTSPNGLRQMFVHREGKLIQTEKNYRLLVERKAQDVLLDKIPWNSSIVKLPWKDDLLFVEW